MKKPRRDAHCGSSQPLLRSRALLLGMLCAVHGTFATAQALAPDAGQTIRETERQPGPVFPQPQQPFFPQADTVPPAAAEDVRLAVSALRVTGSTVIPATVLEALVADVAGAERSLAELNAAAARITARYRKEGYLLARAYLPAQDIVDGVVVIEVSEGLLGAQLIDNSSLLSDMQARRYLSEISSGSVLRQAPVERALFLLNELPGVGAARATLQPGASVGTTDLLVELESSAPYTTRVEVDNFGNRYTGEHRVGVALALNSPLGRGDQLALRIIASDADLYYGRLAWQLPVGNHGLRLGAAWSDTRYQLGKDFAALQAHGTASSGSLFAIYPLFRSQLTRATATLTLESKQLEDFTDVPVTATKREVRLANLGLAAQHQDGFAGGGVTSVDIALVSGKLDLDPAAQALDALTARSNGDFTRLAWTVKRLQRLAERDVLTIALMGQQASRNLNSSEKFALGGVYGVRAYPAGEGNGDQGWLTNLELRHTFLPTLDASLFFDTGMVDVNRSQFGPGSNVRKISGAGLGLHALLAGMQIDAWMAWRTSGGRPLSVPAHLDHQQRLWLQLNREF